MKLIRLYILIFLFSTSLFSQTTPHQMVVDMGTGINLGNILSAPYEGNWASPLTEEYIDNVARLKFKHVRIPIRFDNQTTPFTSVTYTDGLGNYIGSSADYVVNTSYLDRIEQIIDWCIARNLIAIIDVHGDHWFWESFDSSSPYYATGNDRQARIDRFKAIWRDIAARFQNKPDSVLFEIMNEPFFSMSATEVIDINTQILTIIRNTNPTRCVIVTGGSLNSFQAPMQLSSTFLQSDNYLIATFHYYKPFPFTSSASQIHTDNDWGTLSDQNQVQTEFDQVYNWSVQNNIPIFLGEFGADNENGYNYFTQTYGLYGGPDVESRRLYHEFVANYARTKGFALAVWDAGEKSGKTVYLTTPKSWVKDVRNAVLGSTCINSGFISNSDIECNYDYGWELIELNNSILNNSLQSDSFNSSTSLELKINSTDLGTTSIKNAIDYSGIYSNLNYRISCLAKGLNNKKFKFKIKYYDLNGNENYVESSYKTLTNEYEIYDFYFFVPMNVDRINLEIVCQNNIGSYFFDNFQLENTLSICEYENKIFEIYPNPARNFFKITDSDKIKSVSMYSLDGRSINLKKEIDVYFFPPLPSNVYMVKIISIDKKIITKKLILSYE